MMIEFVVAAGEVWTNPFVVGLVVGAPATVLGYQAYRRAERLDKQAAQAALAHTAGLDVQRVIDGLDDMVGRLQTDNKEVRQRATELAESLKACNASYTELKQIVDRSSP